MQTQMAQQLTAQLAPWQHIQIAVNRLGTYLETRLVRPLTQTVADLLRRPLLAQQTQHSVAQSAVHGQPSRLAGTASRGLALGRDRPVIKPRSIPRQLPADHRRTAVQSSGNSPKAQTLRIVNTQFFALGQAHAMITI